MTLSDTDTNRWDTPCTINTSSTVHSLSCFYTKLNEISKTYYLMETYFMLHMFLNLNLNCGAWKQLSPLQLLSWRHGCSLSRLLSCGRCREHLHVQSFVLFCPLSSSSSAVCSSQRPSPEDTSLWSSSSSHFDMSDLRHRVCADAGPTGGCGVQVKWSIPLPWLLMNRSKPVTSECAPARVCCVDCAALPFMQCSEETVLMQAKLSSVKVLGLLRIMRLSALLSSPSQVYKACGKSSSP